eukprot:CAMPEP_0183341086 /NCGR_PEP_ID=MMETSP0164_2-20130417/7411_1 /TAXON_ID=221442 /ORGANISM="Coccolithus pelagicus ssp braarudi, Strain PLY182g" /LENGTH=106 /DNA_ID=CAMNT_0025511317 /DNA_START=479 /DNA_END=799 /DNA_ORIENTATION=+
MEHKPRSLRVVCRVRAEVEQGAVARKRSTVTISQRDELRFFASVRVFQVRHGRIDPTVEVEPALVVALLGVPLAVRKHAPRHVDGPSEYGDEPGWGGRGKVLHQPR